MKEDSFLIHVGTPEGVAFEQPVSYAKLPGLNGELGILKDHAPMLVALDCGKLRVHLESGEMMRYFIPGGVAHITTDHVTILTEYIEPASGIDLKSAQADRAEALRLLEKHKEDTGHIRRKLKNAEARIYIHSLHFGPDHH